MITKETLAQIKPGDMVKIRIPGTHVIEVTGEVWEYTYPTGETRLRIGDMWLGSVEIEIVEHKPAPRKMPTTPGIYVPRSNINMLGNTFSYRLMGDGQWGRSDYNGPTEMSAEDRARHAVENLGGLVRLVPEMTA